MRVLEERPESCYLLAIARSEVEDPRARLMVHATSDRVVRLSDGREVGKWTGYMSEPITAGLWRTAHSCDADSCTDYTATDDEVYVAVLFDSPELVRLAAQAEFVVRADGLHLVGADEKPSSAPAAAKAVGAHPIGIGDALRRRNAVAWS